MGVVEETIAQLRQRHRCPCCWLAVTGPTCSGCGADLTGEAATLLLARSEEAARALELRQQALDAVKANRPATPPLQPLPGGVGSAPVPGAPVTRARVGLRPILSAPAGATAARTAQPNPVAVFSAVGVGAIVAAAVVFAFLVPGDPVVVRTTLVGVTVASAVAMLALRRRRPVSAAAVAVGAVALCLLVIGLVVRPLPDPLLAAALAVGVLGVGLGVAGFGLRLRPWVSAGVLLTPLAAALAAVSYAGEDALWQAAAALVGAVALAAAGRWAARRWQGDAPGPLPLAPERALLTAGAAVSLAGASGLALLGAAGDQDGLGPLGGVVLLAAAAAAYLHGAGPDVGWRRTAGVVAVLAPTAAVIGFDSPALAGCAAGGLGWIALALASSLPGLREGRLAGVLNGGWVATLVLTAPAALTLLAGVAELLDPVEWVDPTSVLVPGWTMPTAGWAVAGLLVAAAAGAVAASLPAGRFGPLPSAPTTPTTPTRTGAADPGPRVPRVGRWSWPWFALSGLAAAAALPVFSTAGSVALLLVLALASGLVAGLVGNAAPALRATTRAGGLVLVVIAAAASWALLPSGQDLVAGGAAVALALGWTRLVPAELRPVLVGLSYSFALVLLGRALVWNLLWQDDPLVPVVGLLTVAASLVSLAVLALPDGGSVSPASPAGSTGGVSATVYTVLGVGMVPWLVSVGTVFGDRTWWAAVAALSMLAVEFVVATRVRREPTWLRVVAAVSLLPTAGILLVNAGAMLIPTSGSPILLPVVAAMAAGTAIAAANWTARIAGIDDRAAGLIRRAFELGALGTAIVCVLLAVALPAAGSGTCLVVCAILAAGAAVVAAQPDRRWVSLLAGLAGAGVLWSALDLLDVGLVEAYTVPVGIAALGAGLVLARNSRRWWALAAGGLGLVIAPTWLLTALAADVVPRAAALTGLALVLVLIAGPVRRHGGGGRPDPLWLLAGGIGLAGTGPFLLAFHSSELFPTEDPSLGEFLGRMASFPLAGFGWVVGAAAVSALLLGFAGQVTRWATAAPPGRWRRLAASWRFAPGLTVAALGAVLAVRPGGAVVLAMWLLCIGFLAVTVPSTLMRVAGRVVLPPVWYSWLLALAVGIAGWSERALRVEHHALPLGLTLLACGVIAWQTVDRHPKGGRSWPIGYSDPARVITPGVLATLGPSTLAIGTDPQTWRAILVLVLALAALLVGARKLWRACMMAGIVDLTVAILLVFVARRGAIDAVPWLIALVGAGGVLLGLAIYSERRQHAVTEPA